MGEENSCVSISAGHDTPAAEEEEASSDHAAITVSCSFSTPDRDRCINQYLVYPHSLHAVPDMSHQCLGKCEDKSE